MLHCNTRSGGSSPGDHGVNVIEENKEATCSKPPAPKFVGHGMAMDSAEHLFAAFPVLVAIANLTGKIGSVKPAKLAGLPLPRR